MPPISCGTNSRPQARCTDADAVYGQRRGPRGQSRSRPASRDCGPRPAAPPDTGSYGAASGRATVHYADGTTRQAALGGPDWYSGSGRVTAPGRYNPAGQKDPHQVVIATAELAMDATKEAVALTLPVTNPAQPNKSSLHIFALTLQPVAEGRALTLRDAHSTSSLLDSGAQSVEATVVNAGTVGILASEGLTLSVDVPGARTVAPAVVTRLAPGDQARVRIGIRRRPGTAPGTRRQGDHARPRAAAELAHDRRQAGRRRAAGRPQRGQARLGVQSSLVGLRNSRTWVRCHQAPVSRSSRQVVYR